MPRSVPRKEWKWFGVAGHFIAADSCCLRLTTEIGNVRISTVGCSHEKGNREPREIGLGRKFETFVFPIYGDPDPEWFGLRPVTDWTGEVDSEGYNSAEDAHVGHIRMCEKWAATEGTR